MAPSGITSFVQEGRYIEGLIAQPMVIARPAGGHTLIADDRAVQLSFIDAEQAVIYNRACFTPPTHIELVATGRRLGLAGVLLPIRSDRRHEVQSSTSDGPVLTEESRAPGGGLPLPVPRRDTDGHTFAGSERRKQPVNQN